MYKALTYNGTAFLTVNSGFDSEQKALDFIIDLSYEFNDSDDLQEFLFNSSVVAY